MSYLCTVCNQLEPKQVTKQVTVLKRVFSKAYSEQVRSLEDLAAASSDQQDLYAIHDHVMIYLGKSFEISESVVYFRFSWGGCASAFPLPGLGASSCE